MIINKLLTLGLVLYSCVCGFRSAQGTEPHLESGKLGQNQVWETDWQVFDSGKPGPVVLVIGGVHGNEPAGRLAAEQIKSWRVHRGKLVVIANANRLGSKANIRWFPPHRNDKALRDLNRNFPKKNRPEAVTDIAQVIWSFVKKQKPQFVFDLHEGFDFHRLNSKSVGSSVITFPGQKEWGQNVVDHVNQEVSPDKKFDLLAKSGPVNGSLARACGEQLNAKSFIFETTFKDQPISYRTRQHRQMVAFSLNRLSMVDRSIVNRLVDAQKTDGTRVGVFDGNGANPNQIVKVISDKTNLVVRHIGPNDIEPEILTSFDVLVFPGGSGSKQGRAIGAEGRLAIRKFVEQGGGIVGVCAGAYLCSSHYDWSLHLMNAKVFNEMVEIPGKGRKSMWFRGPGTNVDVEIAESGKPFLGLTGKFSVRYQNGPIISRDDHKDVPDYKVLATFRSENGIYEAQKGTMIGRPAVLESRFGKGKVLAISPHFESTTKTKDVIAHAIGAVARK